MAKKETSPELTEEFRKTLSMTKMLDIEVDDELKRSFIAYAMAVNKSRAIPDARDGLKPVHRRILYSMHEMGLYNDKAFKKCARIVGDCMGKYHPHGDSSVYDALVRLAQEFTISFPLVDGHGNFGSVDGDPAAAMRYTEARLTKLAAEMLKDLDKDTVDFIPNFDGSEEEPTVLPARYRPTFLLIIWRKSLTVRSPSSTTPTLPWTSLWNTFPRPISPRGVSLWAEAVSSARIERGRGISSFVPSAKLKNTVRVTTFVPASS